jgi:hypothetical protein
MKFGPTSFVIVLSVIASSPAIPANARSSDPSPPAASATHIQRSFLRMADANECRRACAASFAAANQKNLNDPNAKRDYGQCIESCGAQ